MMSLFLDVGRCNTHVCFGRQKEELIPPRGVQPLPARAYENYGPNPDKRDTEIDVKTDSPSLRDLSKVAQKFCPIRLTPS